jgi:hypothetical protein
LLLLLMVGCGGTDAPEDQPDLAPVVPHNFAQINSVIFATSCSFSVCHSTRGSHDADRLDLTQDALSALVNAPAQNTQALADGLMRVKPCDPDHSFLVTKLTMAADNNDSDHGYGAHMPLKNPSLPDAQLQAIRDWVARGAHADEPDDVTGTACVR